MDSILFKFKNKKGEVVTKRVIPESIEFLRNPSGHQPGWFLSGHDLDKDARRSFPLTGIILPQDQQSRTYYQLFRTPKDK